METGILKILEGKGYLLAIFVVCLCSMGLMCFCWYLYGELITEFYQTNVSEDFGKEERKQK
ncbi:hypothetical protein BBBOND_0303210 [Babesia bigemina]|uniref:Uncharacterized protein n=1 Tax=Babesia bigemina TaxID=5866 RepID=A0A061D8X0_BABBI|nr:hypothetical protein BBBOND_0303210 [Babesia bigemina]CDR96417.1 hypothetical protein BBBOND_0303210 [Babesia bigemina]|eukprot:XP_012768603.1 hypothetical protein BBBOND_0303210 [Babesia bigemina]